MRKTKFQILNIISQIFLLFFVTDNKILQDSVELSQHKCMAQVSYIFIYTFDYRDNTVSLHIIE